MSRRALPRLAATALCATVAIAATPADAAAQTPAHRLVTKTNHARIRHDRRPYRVGDSLKSVARHWARWMAAHRVLEHNSALTREVSNWCYLGENVGRGRSARNVEHAFMASPPHRRNILSRHYRQVGIGAHWDGHGHLYVDEVFRKSC